MGGGSGYEQVVSELMKLSAYGTNWWRLPSSQGQWLARIAGLMGMLSCASRSLNNSSRLSSKLDILGDDRAFSAESPQKVGSSIGISVSSWILQQEFRCRSEKWGAESWGDVVPCSGVSRYVFCSGTDISSGWDWELDDVHDGVFVLICMQTLAGGYAGRLCLGSGKVLRRESW